MLKPAIKKPRRPNSKNRTSRAERSRQRAKRAEKLSSDWRIIPNHPIYEVSDAGYIRRRSDGFVPRRYLLNGHLRVSNLNGGLIATAMLRAFGISELSNIRVAYRDGNPRNCSLDNLQIAKYSEKETKHARNTEIIQLRSQGWMMRDIAKQLGITVPTVSKVFKKSGDPRQQHVEKLSAIDPATLSRAQRNALMVDLRTQKYTLAEIGALFGMSRQAVHQILVKQKKRT